MGEVYLAQDVRLGRSVAIKVLPSELAEDPGRRQRFTQEARSASALKHPNVAHIYDIGASQGLNYIVMEHIDGETLAHRLQRGPVNIEEALDVVKQTADALADAHRQNITHRDIKPSNLMITPRGHVKVLDFGLAHRGHDLDATMPLDAMAADGEHIDLTSPGEILGTAPYMSPEQASGTPVGPASDVFSLGVVLYEMLSGVRPFTGNTKADILAGIRSGRCPDVTEKNPQVPAGIAHLVRTCMHPRLQERYPSAAELLDAVRTLDTKTVSSGRAAVHDVSGQSDEKLRDRVKALAVMPLENRSKDEDAAYLCEGIAENLISTLAELDELTVMSRYASFKLHDQRHDIEEVARRLNVDALLLGDLVQRGGRMIINMELVKASDSSLLWGERYDRPLDEAANIERDVVRQVTRALTQELSSGSHNTKQHEPDPKAYLLFLKGKALTVGSAAQMLKGREYLEAAVETDPQYALPYVSLANAYLNLHYHGLMARNEVRREAKKASTQAVRLAPDLPEAYNALGQVNALDWDWDEAEANHRKAVEMGPKRDWVLLSYSEYLSDQGRLEEALKFAEQARSVDPVSPNPSHLVGYVLMLMHDYIGSIKEFKTAIDLHPDWIWGHIKLANAYSRNGNHEFALAEAKLASQALAGAGTPLAKSWLAYVYTRAGELEKAKELQFQIESADDADPACVQFYHAALGEKAKVLECLQQAYRQRSGLSGSIQVIGFLLPELELEKEPVFIKLLRDMDFPAYR